MEYFYNYEEDAVKMQLEQRITIDYSTNKRGTRGTMITQKIPEDMQYTRTIRKRYPSLYDVTIAQKHYFDNNKASILDKPFPCVSLEYIGGASLVPFYLGTEQDFTNDIATLQAVIQDINNWGPKSKLAEEEKATLLEKYTNVKTKWDAELQHINNKTKFHFSMDTSAMMFPSS